MNTKLLSAIIVAALAIAAATYWYTSARSVPTEVIEEPEQVTSPEAENMVMVRLYYYNPANDQGPGGVQCTAAGLVAVSREVPRTVTPIQDAIRLLIKGELSAEERAQGITTEFPLSGFSLQAASLSDGELTLTFDDPEHSTVGGSCRASILWRQIEATAKQFTEVESVKFSPEELFQP